MRPILMIAGVFFFLFAFGLFLAQYDVRIIRDELEPPRLTDFYDYRGVTHVHTNRHLGSGSEADIIVAAQTAGLDFLILTDLNDFKRDLETEGYHRKLLVLRGTSISYLDSRILAYDFKRRLRLESLGQSQVLMADLLSQSGDDANQDLLVLAHPFKPGYSWKGPFPSGLDGIEVLNLKSIWQAAWIHSKLSFAWSLLIYPFNSQLAFLRMYSEPRAELQLWDQLNKERKTIGFAGSEATAKTASVGGAFLKFPPYNVSFSLMTNHVLLTSELTGEPESDRRKLFDALNSGQFYMSLDILGNPKGFSAVLEDGEKHAPLGSKAKYKAGLRLRVRLPQKPRSPFEIAFIKDGELVASSNSVESDLNIDGRGFYRVIVRVIPTLPLPDGKRWITWIYTNPFYVE